MKIRPISSFFLLGGFIAATAINGCSATNDGGGGTITAGKKGGTDPTAGSTSDGGNGSVGEGGLNFAGNILAGNGPGDECLGANPDPEKCRLVTPPACGDGKINVDGEACDDGNSVPGDGCTGICKVEPNFECPTEGEPCVTTFACGNGELEPGEICDDGNTEGGDEGTDGCNFDCTVQNASYACPTPGEACVKTTTCGDLKVQGAENCEDGNTDPNDGCSADCTKEPGFSCPVVNEPCRRLPYCGDAKMQPSNNEACDDGNTQSGDGCASDCLAIESGFECPSPGEPCVNTARCGDGRVQGTETCDDANENPADGCDACQTQVGYDCPFPGALCIPLCGDGILLLNEICDDGNIDANDGCSPYCRWEDNFVCTGDPGAYHCEPTVCGNGIQEGTEGCDDGNNNMGDGCTPFCKKEPICEGGACQSTCGDGLLLTSMGEVCDDGNTVPGDGCSADCQVEAGYQCDQPPLGATMSVPIVYRDFESGGDFEPADAVGQYPAVTGLADGTLDAEGKPVFVGSPGDGYITNASSFANWYRDVPGTNATLVSTLTLYDNGNGGYVNRYGANGEQWIATSGATDHWCGDVGSEALDADGNPMPCTFCSYDEVPETPECDPAPQDTDCQTFADQLVQCTNDGSAYHGIFRDAVYDGNPVFFPVDDMPNSVTATSDYGIAKIPLNYDGNWENEPGEPLHNFHFTSEVRYWFTYNAGDAYTLDFTGDDDVWVFINNRLAVDLGGIHTPVSGTLTLDATGGGTVVITQSQPEDAVPTTQTVDLGLQDGQVYEIVVFQAERKKEASTYKLTLSGFNAAATLCGPICGDGVLSPGEQCDDGTNAGGYGQCQPGCIRGPYCGDGTVQPENEQCDNGENTSPYGADGCAPGCVTPARCGDGIVQGDFEEECDGGEGCDVDCTRGPFCGDGTVDPGEGCDQGLNDSSYKGCNPDCTPGPDCGDGTLDVGFEDCDDGNRELGDGCSPNCRMEGTCGDAIKSDTEECDDGTNDGSYGNCAPGCVLGPRCGDTVVQAEAGEECDGGPNPTGLYGECAVGCKLGPHCGDGTVQPGYEDCDDSNRDVGDGCSACKNEIVIPL